MCPPCQITETQLGPFHHVTETQLGKSRGKISAVGAAERIFWKKSAERIFWRFRAKIVEELLIPLFYFDNHFWYFSLNFGIPLTIKSLSLMRI
jgi:hypothetical protein